MSGQTVNPWLVFAGRDVLQHAEKLIPGRVLELEVTKSIHAGRKLKGISGMPALPPDHRYVVLEGGKVAAVVSKGRARLTERPAWRVERLVRVSSRPAHAPERRGRVSRPRDSGMGTIVPKTEGDLEARIEELLARYER